MVKYWQLWLPEVSRKNYSDNVEDITGMLFRQPQILQNRTVICLR